MFEDKPDIFTVADIASILCVSKGTVYKLISNGELPSRKVGRKIIVTKKNLIAYVEQINIDPQRQTDSSVGKVVSK